MSISENLVKENRETRTHPAALLVALALLALVLIVVLWRLQPPAPKGSNAPGGEFSAGRAMDILHDLLAEQVPHPLGSATNDRVRERLIARLEAMGYEAELQETVACRHGSGAGATCSPVINILAELPGRQDGPAVMVVAHYDSVGAGPGAADDSSSVVAMLEMARILKDEGPHRNPIFFVFTDGEEVGLLGAEGFASQHPRARQVSVAVNLEARGTTGRSLMFETSEGNAWLVDALADSVPQPATNSLMYEVYKVMPNDTDLSVFKAAGMGGLNFAYIGRPQHYHTALDNLANVDPGSVQHQGDSVLAVVRELAARDLANPPGGDAAYMDVLGLGLVTWPAGWNIPLAAVALILLLVPAGLLIRRGALSVGGLLWGLLAALLALILPILLGLALTWLIRTLSGVERPWFAYPLPTRLSLWAGALLCAGLVAGGLARRAGFWGLGLGVWLLNVLLALILGLALPGAAITLLLPALCAALLVAAVVLAGLSDSPPAGEAAFIAAALFGAMLWLPMALNFEAAVSFDLVPAVALWVALLAGTLAPLFALPQSGRRAGRALVLVAAAVVVVAAGIALFLPHFSEYSPQRLSLYYVEDRDRGTAHWTAVPETGGLPDELGAVLDGQPQAVFPWSTDEWPAATATATGAPAPDVEVVAEAQAGSGRIVDLRLRSPRGAEGIDLWVPLDNLASVEVAGQALPVDPAVDWTRTYRLVCYGHLCDGLTLRLGFSDSSPVQVLVADSSPGLPPEGAALLQARPATAVPGRMGDLTMIARRVEF